MPVDPFGASSASGGGVSRGFAPADVYDPYASLNRGGGNPAYFGVADGNTQKRQFASVGKANINLLDPLSQSRADANYMPIDAPDEGPLGGIGRYYSPSTPGGLFAGLIGAVTQTVGGVFGQEGAQAGAQIGQTIGKTIEAPLAIVGGMGLESVPFVAPIIDKANSAIEEHSPYILRDTLKIPTNLGGAFQSLLNVFGLAGRAVERTYAGMQGQRGALPEDIQARIDSGELTHDQALDELVMGGRGFTNDPMHNLVFSILTDPGNWASLGVGAVAGAVKGTTSVARVFASAALRDGGAVARLAGTGTELGNLADAARAGENLVGKNFSREALGGMRRAVNQDMLERVQAGEDIPSELKLKMVEKMGMSALGPVTDEATRNIVYRAAQWTAKVTDPVNFFSGSKAGERSMEQLHMAAATGLIAAVKPKVVRRITAIADAITSDGGDRVMEATGTWGGNALQEVASHDSMAAAAQLGAVPKIGSFSATEANRQVLASGGYDTNLGKVVETHIERTKDVRVASLPPKQMYDETVRKFAAILGVDARQVDARMGGSVTPDEAMYIHGLYYYTKGKVLHTDVVNELKQMQQSGTLKDLVARTGIDPGNVMMVTPRTLTDKKLGSTGLEAALKSGDETMARSITENFDDFNWVNDKSVPKGEFIDAINEWLAANKAHLPREVELIDPATGLPHIDLGPGLEKWAQDAGDLNYGLAKGIPADAGDEALFRVSRKSNGTIRNINPFLDFWADGIPAAQRLSRWDATKMSMFRGVRGERIWWNQRRRFITDMTSTTKGPDHVPLPPALADQLFRSLMSTASAGNLLPRGMAPEQMMEAVARVLNDARAHNAGWGGIAGQLTDRQVTLGFLRAMEGDVSMVGVTQKVTGRIKSGAPGAAANYWGQLSEKLYPLMRFTLNPVFMAMEYVEPHILNYMRGVPLPLRRNQPDFEQGLATTNAVRRLIFASEDPDGLLAESMEMNALKVGTANLARNNFGPTTMWGKIRGSKPAIAQRKSAAAGLEARALIGDNLYAAFKAIKGDQFDKFWGGLEYQYGTVSRAEVAERWLASNLGLQDADGRLIGLTMDLHNPVNVGQRIRISTDGARPGDYQYGDVEKLLDSIEAQKSAPGALFKDNGRPPGEALLEWLRDPNVSEADWLDRIAKAGLAPRFERASQSAASDVYRLANGVQLEPFWKGYRDAILRNVTGPTPALTRKLRDQQIASARAFVQAAAKGKSLSEEEFIALHFAEVPRWLANYVADPNNVQRTLTDLRADFGHSILSRSQGGSRAADISSLKYAITSKDVGGVKSLDHPWNAKQVVGLRKGNENEEYLFAGLSPWELQGLERKAKGGYGEPLVTQKYGRMHSDPLRAITQRNATSSAMVRIRKDAVEATQETPGTKKMKRHDYVLDEDVHAGKGMEVYTDKGWVPWDEYVKEPGGIPSVNLRNAPREEYLSHLYADDLGTPGGSQSFGIDFRNLHSIDQKLATDTYEGSGHGPINRFLRGIKKSDGYGSSYTDAQLQSMADEIDSLVQRGTLRERKMLMRGTSISPKYLHEFDKQVGEVMEDKGFISTSDSMATAQDFFDFGEASYEPGSRQVYIEYDLPPGFHANLIEGGEAEYLLGRDIRFRIVRREDTYMQGEKTIALRVTPENVETLPRMNHDMMGEPLLHRRNEELTRHLAATDPAQLRARAARAPENVREGLQEVAEEYIAKAEAAKPGHDTTIGGRRFGQLTPQDTLDDITKAVDAETIPAYHGAMADDRGRVEELMRTEGVDYSGNATEGRDYNSNGARALVAIGGSIAEKGGRAAWHGLTSTMERLWHHGPENATSAARDTQLANQRAQALLRGLKHPLAMHDVSARTDDAIDAVLGNDSRRAIGRTDLSQPIVADDAAYEGAGYLTQDTLDDLTSQGHDVGAIAAPPQVFRPGADHAAVSIPGNPVEVGAPYGPQVRGTFAEPAPEGITTAGVIIQEADGRVWVYEPKGHFGGYEHTWPKGRPDAGEDLRDAALREAQEEMGFTVELTGYAGDFDNVQGTSRARFYTAKRTGGGPTLAGTEETAAIKLVSPADARRLLIHDGIPDTRDHAILDTVAPEPTAKTIAPEQPVVPSEGYMDPVQDLGGSTGATLVQGGDGALYVQKQGDSAAHITEEHYADDVYEAMGVAVPKQTMVESAPVATKRANYIGGGQTLDDFVRTASPEEVQKVYDQLGENFALDALLANWDVVGLVGDNIVVKDGIAYRVDNGGALRFRAMGEPKSTMHPTPSVTAPQGGMWGPKVSELDKMRSGGNEWQKRVFGGLSDVAVRQQVLDLAAKSDTLLAALPPELRDLVSQRLDDMLEQTAHIDVPATGGGLVADAITDETHAHLSAHYNEVARLANEQGLGGFKDWKPVDVASLAGRARENMGRTPAQGISEAIRQQTQVIPSEVYFPKGSKMEWINPILDLLNQPGNEAARDAVVGGVQTTILQRLRDELGIIVTNSDSRGIGVWGDEAAQPLVPLHFVASDARGAELADILSYVMRQREVWHFAPSDVADDFASFDPRVTITLPAGAPVKDIAKSLPFAKGSTAIEQPGGGWVLTVIDRDKTFERLDNGAVNRPALQRQLEETLQGVEGDWAGDLDVDYGKTYVAGPKMLDDGTPDWEGHLDATLASLAGRGAPTDGAVLDGVRSAYERSLYDHVSDASPDNYLRAQRGDPVSAVLEDRRGGSVFGTTTPVGADAAIVRGYGANDALTGIHELVHVFSIAGLDTSVRDAVGREWAQQVTHVEARIKHLENVVATSPTKSVVTRARNEITALQADLQTPSNGSWSKAQEEFFVHLVLDWTKRGMTTNPDLANSMEHFRNWLQLQAKQRAANGLPPVQSSPAMDVVLGRMFSRPGLETVPYSVEQEVLRQAGRQVVRQSWDEAHTTQYYKKDRSMFERSINHPYIGLYPASYMWGKVLPEMMRFLALRPFGMTTPFLGLNVAREVSDSVRTQSENDPSFKKFLSDNEDAFMFMSMFFPALPQDIPANVSLPLRRVAEQGLESQQAIAEGGEAKDIEFAKGAQDAIQYAVGPLGTIRTTGDMVGMGGDLIRSTLGIKTSDDVTREPLPLR